uniref:Uncharacterized protein n=1 Tax=Utricularia reniformis TaxID=192314 RepID=A0A1Y0AZ54_9LAMI|nr:hypothetical protein AEK19_MT0173 [Utricularia reniformis]ART30455.1 hypothetical protein AEK19_MT0173 [Utricularia reniformis]
MPFFYIRESNNEFEGNNGLLFGPILDDPELD